MRYRVRWTPVALGDLEAALDWIAEADPAAAKRMRQRLRRAVVRLETFPTSGRIVPERATRGWREIVVSPYRVVYDVTAAEVHVLRVWHSKRDLREPAS